MPHKPLPGLLPFLRVEELERRFVLDASCAISFTPAQEFPIPDGNDAIAYSDHNCDRSPDLVWDILLVLYVIPAALVGNMQSLRKYVEHMGLTGSSVLSSTRSVVARGPVGRLVAFSLLDIPYHGVHHRFAGLPHARLVDFSSILAPTRPGELLPYPNYRSALWGMLRSLIDPRIGAQWNRPG